MMSFLRFDMLTTPKSRIRMARNQIEEYSARSATYNRERVFLRHIVSIYWHIWRGVMLHRVERLSNNEQLYDKSVRDDMKVASILGNIKYSLKEIGDLHG